jgi:hypothetical protein
MEFLISGILCGLVILLSFIIYKRKIKRNSNVIRDEIYRKEKEKIVVQVQKELDVLYDKKSQIEREIDEKLSFNNSMLQLREEELNRLIEAKREEKIKLLNEQADNYYNEQLKLKKDLLISFEILNEEEKQKAQQELQRILLELEEHRMARETINQAILREREIQEKEEFYKILVTEDDKNDIQILEEIKNKLRNKEALQKLIWEIFIKRPALEMIKRVTAGKKISGIYKVTYLKTGESYIGRSVDIGNRWTEHVKSSLSIGTIAHSSFHNRLEKDGIWNYSWEILEELPKEKNNEREKYWINFYETNKYGLNQRDGG